MRLVQFQRLRDGGGVRVGVERGEGLGVVDLKAFDPSMPSTMRELLELGDKGLQCAQRYHIHSYIPSTIFPDPKCVSHTCAHTHSYTIHSHTSAAI